MDLKEILRQVCDLALEVGQFQRQQRVNFSLKCVESKNSHDYVSYVDKQSETMIVSRLCEILPDASFITEEKTIDQTHDDTEYVWIVDPLDGTTNYIHDLGPWCVCIALRDSYGLRLGVVYEVVRDELYYAIRGGGAWLRKGDGSISQLHVSSTADLDQALVLVGYPYNAAAFSDFCMYMSRRLYGHCASLRSFGSAEAELCYVAAGRLDVYFESYLQPWDVSAGALIVMEAGGAVSDYFGSDTLWPSGRQMLATNSLLHPSVLSIMAEYSEE